MGVVMRAGLDWGALLAQWHLGSANVRGACVSRVRFEFSPRPRAHRSDREVRSGGREARTTYGPDDGSRSEADHILRAFDYSMPEESKGNVVDA